MERVTLAGTEREARRLVAAAFERADGTVTYERRGRAVVGRTGVSLATFGVRAEAWPRDGDEGETVVEIEGEPCRSGDLLASPDQYVAALAAQLRALDGHDPAAVAPDESVEEALPMDPLDTRRGRVALYAGYAGRALCVLGPLLAFALLVVG
jgi:hypothetical protein